jgi:hypothetical protein
MCCYLFVILIKFFNLYFLVLLIFFVFFLVSWPHAFSERPGTEMNRNSTSGVGPVREG